MIFLMLRDTCDLRADVFGILLRTLLGERRDELFLDERRDELFLDERRDGRFLDDLRDERRDGRFLDDLRDERRVLLTTGFHR